MTILSNAIDDKDLQPFTLRVYDHLCAIALYQLAEPLKEQIHTGELAVGDQIAPERDLAQPKLTHNALHLLGFSEEMARLGSTVRSMVLRQALDRPSKRIAEQVQMALRIGMRKLYESSDDRYIRG